MSFTNVNETNRAFLVSRLDLRWMGEGSRKMTSGGSSGYRSENLTWGRDRNAAQFVTHMQTVSGHKHINERNPKMDPKQRWVNKWISMRSRVTRWWSLSTSLETPKATLIFKAFNLVTLMLSKHCLKKLTSASRMSSCRRLTDWQKIYAMPTNDSHVTDFDGVGNQNKQHTYVFCVDVNLQATLSVCGKSCQQLITENNSTSSGNKRCVSVILWLMTI